MQDATIHCTAQSLKAVASPFRLRILFALSGGELSVQELTERVGSTHSNISHHLATLRKIGILHCRRQANRVFYGIEDERMQEFIGLLSQCFNTTPKGLHIA